MSTKLTWDDDTYTYYLVPQAAVKSSSDHGRSNRIIVAAKEEDLKHKDTYLWLIEGTDP